LKDHPLVIFSPGVSEEEAAMVFWEGYRLCATWGAVLFELTPHLKEGPTVGVVCCAPLQVPNDREADRISDGGPSDG
jgi:hypothetical protein